MSCQGAIKCSWGPSPHCKGVNHWALYKYLVYRAQWCEPAQNSIAHKWPMAPLDESLLRNNHVVQRASMTPPVSCRKLEFQQSRYWWWQLHNGHMASKVLKGGRARGGRRIRRDEWEWREDKCLEEDEGETGTAEGQRRGGGGGW